MPRLSPPTAAALAAAAMALSACQDKSLDATAQAARPTPADPTVSTAVTDVRADAIDPVTGKARGADKIFMGAVGQSGPAAGPAMPASSLGDPSAMSRTLQGLTPDGGSAN